MGRWTRVAAVVLPILALAAFSAPRAGAQPGSLIADVAPFGGDFVGVSVAFDGQYLYYTTEADGDTMLHRIAPSGDPATHSAVPIVGAPGITAFSYDATRDRFWGAGLDGTTIYLIDKNGAATPAFTVNSQVGAYRFCDNLPDLNGCQPPVDGIAYDAEHDTVWYSPDESSRIYEFDAIEPSTFPLSPGYLADFFDVNDFKNGVDETFGPECGTTIGLLGPVAANFNSGVAASAGSLYLGAPDCMNDLAPRFYQYAKTPVYCPNAGGAVPAAVACAPCPPNTTPYCIPPTPCLDTDVSADTPAAKVCPGDKITSYPYTSACPTGITPPPPCTRPEDLECDNVTFPVDVVWIRDSFDGHMRAYEVPTGTCIFGGGITIQPTKSRMTGGGYLAPTALSVTQGQAYHGFMLHCDKNVLPNRLQVSWGNGMHFHMTSSSSAMCDKSLTSSTMNHEHGIGVGRLNGVQGYQVEWDFTDNGEPGSGAVNPDMGTITIKNSAGMTLYSWSGPLLGGNYQMHVAQ